MGANANEAGTAEADLERAVTRASSSDDDFALGVLVVHGIGDQKQGATLTTWVDALSEWCNTRDSKTTDPDQRRLKAQVRRAMLRPADGPANVELNVTSSRARTNPNTDHTVRTTNSQTWLVAEGWWASTFEPPSFGEIWSWSFISVPATAAMHANAMVASAIRRWKSSRGAQAIYEGARLAVMILFLITLVMLSPLILVLLTLLLVLGLIAAALPIDALRSLVAKAQLISVGTIGDTKRLIDSPTQAGAIKSPVADGIAWLRERGCKKVVVLAHSQGAAVTYKTLVDMSEGLHGRVEPIDAFISVGSGLPKVHALEYLSSPAGLRLRLASVAVPMSAVVGALSLRFLRESGALSGFVLPLCILAATGAFLFTARFISTRRRGQFGLLASFLALSLIGLIAAVITTLVVDQSVVVVVAMLAITLGLGAVYTLATEEIPPVPNTLERATRRWIDLWGSVDPVPAGPTRTNLAGRPETWRVTNLGSVALDHNSYPANDDECLALIGTELLQHAGIGTPELARPRLNPTERRWRVAWRSINAYLLGGAVIVFALTTWRGADEAAHRWYATLMQPDGLVNTWYPGDLPGFIPDSISARIADVASGLAYVLLGFIAVQLGHRVWASWNRVESQWAISSPLQNDISTDDDDSPTRQDATTAATSSDPAAPQPGDGAFKAMIALIVFVWFIALVPQWAWASWRSLDLTSWRGLAVLAGAIGVPIAIGTAFPMLLRSLNIKQWAMSRDSAHVDGLVGYGRYLLREGKTKQAVKVLRQAVAMTHQAGHDNADALGTLALALTRLAPRRRRRAAMSRTIASNTGVHVVGADQDAIDAHLRAADRMETEAKILDLEALELYAQATELRISTPDMLVLRIAHENAMQGSRVTVRSLLEQAYRSDRNDPAVVRAMVDFEADEVIDREPRVDHLREELEHWGPTDRLLGLYSLLVEWTMHPPADHAGIDADDSDSPIARLRSEIDALLAADHRAPLADTRPLKMRIEQWTATENVDETASDVAATARQLLRLIERIAGTVGPLDLTDGSAQRTQAVTTHV